MSAFLLPRVWYNKNINGYNENQWELVCCIWRNSILLSKFYCYIRRNTEAITPVTYVFKSGKSVLWVRHSLPYWKRQQRNTRDGITCAMLPEAHRMIRSQEDPHNNYKSCNKLPMKTKTRNTVYECFATRRGDCLPGSNHFLQSTISPAMFATVFANVEHGVDLSPGRWEGIM
jgi:hypothetical protein